MKQGVMDAELPFLPQEIIRNVLIRLPAKSIIRFRCVCKHWKNLFKNPSFIADHLHHSRNRNPYLLFQRNGRANPLNLYLLDCEMKVCEFPNAPLIGSLLGATIIGSSNGLLCVQIDRNGIYPPSLLLWNPAIREVRQVPRTINDFVGDCRLGFGYSPVVDDYKIVRSYANFGGAIDWVEVFSLSTGSWKDIDFGNLGGVKLFSETVTGSWKDFDFRNILEGAKPWETVNADGAMFWYGSKLGVEQGRRVDIDFIVSFDIATEVFTLIPWPALNSNSSAKLTVYDNKLAVLSNNMVGDFEYVIDLWVMEERNGVSGERCSWAKKYSCSQFMYSLNPATIWRNEIVCNVDRPGFSSFMVGSRLIRETEPEAEDYEPKTHLSLTNLNTKKFRIFSVRRCRHDHLIFNYVESLVPVGNYHVEEP
ncbi:putative F-box protein At3g16210 [Prosopis cineraria]|uniref:putative F-box protein At3g16210 n=1 Tax=Prosopis cineraria TaxID=364024 RepID=UPI00240F1A7C|nr:putative F-box protein At3g16210 [Prosopis cineraria]